MVGAQYILNLTKPAITAQSGMAAISETTSPRKDAEADRSKAGLVGTNILKFSKDYCFLSLFIVVWWAASMGSAAQAGPASWRGVLNDAGGKVVADVQVGLRDARTGRAWTATTDEQGAFAFPAIPPGSYSVDVRWHDRTINANEGLKVGPGEQLVCSLQIGEGGGELILRREAATGQAQASGGQRLSSRQVSALPLNRRDFSQLLLLAAGTMTDTNGSSNFTQQFAVNGQRGSTAVFAMDGADSSDPEAGGATFTNFNVDAVQEIESLSGVMPAEVGAGAAAFTNIKTKAGTDLFHGSVFEFVRNSAFDARNFFDRRTLADPGRLPPFRRNEFGFALGGPLTLPGIYQGRGRTYFFGQYQGFRQVLGTTQVLSVPTVAERQGQDTTAFPGDTLHVPVNPEVQPILAAYPLPNDPLGSYGARTYATSAKVSTDSDQFSLRLDHRISDRDQFFARFSLDNVSGPLINPDQSAINPSFATQFINNQRSLGLNYTRTVSSHFLSETTLGYIRTTPLDLPVANTQPGMTFADGLFEAFNSYAGSIMGFYSNLYQARQNFTWVHGAHTLKFGVEFRSNHDTAVYGVNINGQYVFGGGTAYAPEEIPSASGQHNIPAGAPLPDTLAGFLTGTPFSYNIMAASDLTPKGDRFDAVAIRRQAYNFFFQDTWKVSPRLSLNYGLRYEVNSRFHEAELRTSTFRTVGTDGRPAPFWEPGAHQIMLLNLQPPYLQDWNGWGPRVSVEWHASSGTVLRAGGAITTLLPQLGLENILTGVFPFIVTPNITALPSTPVPFHNAVVPLQLPDVYTISGEPAFPTGRTTDVAPNTGLDVPRYQADLAALTPGHQAQPLWVYGTSPVLPYGYIPSYTGGVEHTIKDIVVNASYVATVGVKLPAMISPNAYSGASPEFARFTQFDSTGQILGGYGPEYLMGTPSHSTYHALQVSASKNSARLGLGFQSGYTLSKSLDDTSSIVFNFTGPAGTVLQTFPQNPWNSGAEKGPSAFNLAQAFSVSIIQILPLDRVGFLRPLGKKFVSGWQFLNITTFASGSPFTVYSGIQQTGAGAGGGDRPDQIAAPNFSTGRTAREDYFGRGVNNTSFFSIPIDVPGGTGPNEGRFGTLGRNTFRGPNYYNFDLALIKDTALGSRAKSEPVTLEFRAEFFNAFNLVTFGLPANILRGSGFGVINRTAGTSRQIQFSLKVIF